MNVLIFKVYDLSSTPIIMTRCTCPIYEAAKGNHEDALQLLIDHGARVDYCIEFYNSDIIIPIFKAFEDQDYNAVRLLLKHGASLDKNGVPMHALQYAVQAGECDIVSYLLTYTSRRDLDDDGVTLLIMAIEHNYVDVVKVLLDYEVTKDVEYEIDRAIELNYDDIADVLMDYQGGLYQKMMDELQSKRYR